MSTSETDQPAGVLDSGPCPQCSEPVAPAEALMVCEILACDGCEAELEVVGLSPLVFALAPEVEEDWGE